MSRTWKNPIEGAAGHGGKRAAKLGQAGVHAVASKLCLLDHNVFFPTVDEGVDLIVGNGVRVQVKVAHLTYPVCGTRNSKGLGNYLGGCYIFGLRRGSWSKEEGRYLKKYYRSYEGTADFFVLWGIDENRFWIVPTSIKNRNIYFGRKDHPNQSNNRTHTQAVMDKRNAEMEDRWDLLDVNAAVEKLAANEIEVKEKL